MVKMTSAYGNVALVSMMEQKSDSEISLCCPMEIEKFIM